MNVNKLNDVVEGMLKIEMILGIIVLAMVTLLSCKMPEIVEENKKVKEETTTENKKIATVVIDPGHGGIDPGKVGINGVNEKEVNLAISMKLADALKENCNIIMTRNSDNGLYSDSDSNKKMADMRARCRIINEVYENDSATVNVSIHQNSFSSESVCGPQVFYYSKSEKSKKLANVVQKFLNEKLNISKPREAKPNDSYYMLLHTNCPSIIVECGFLSNREEAQKLTEEAYQQQLAQAICEAVNEYILSNSSTMHTKT